jgi:hypothetical protein
MGPSKASSAFRTAAALVGLALVVIGPAACGSSSSKQTSTAAKKQAGLTRGVRLEVKNASASSTGLTLCVPGGDCKVQSGTLKPGESVALAADEVQGIFDQGTQASFVYFRGVNPTVGAPYVSMEGSDGVGHGDGNPRKFSPDEGQSDDLSLQGQSFTVTRRADIPDYKVFELTLTK